MPTIGEVLAAGVAQHRQGNLAEAERLYQAILQTDAQQADAWHLWGLIDHVRGAYAAAAEKIARAIELDGGQASFYFNLAAAQRGLGHTAEAILNCRRAIALQADFAQAHYALGLALREQGQLDEARDALQQALALDGQMAAAHVDLGTLWQAEGRLDEAVACYRRALHIDDQNTQAHFNLGTALDQQQRRDEAADCYRRALQCRANLPEAHFRLGLGHHYRGELAEAAECYARAIQQRPDYVEAYSNLGTVHRAEGNLAAAIDCYQRALEFGPDTAEVLCNLGNVFKAQGRIPEAEVCYQQTLRILPTHAQARYNRSLMLLAGGDLARGWAEYECRTECGDFVPRQLDQPRWRGEPLGGRRLLVHAEQGLGDTLQFVRYLHLLPPRADDGAQIWFEVQPALVPILAQSGFKNLVPRGAPLPEYDVQVPLLSLPGIFGTTLESIPADIPYLRANPALIDAWREKLSALTGPKVGIAWQGSQTYRDDRFRSIPLAQFAPLADCGAHLISLQKGPGSEQLSALAGRWPLVDLSAQLDAEHGPFMDTAAVMQGLDLVIAADTSLVHLAGGLGVPVWVAQTVAVDWRWMHYREDSPWYPTLRLFRQQRLGDWTEVFARLALALRQFLK